jgi:amidase
VPCDAAYRRSLIDSIPITLRMAQNYIEISSLARQRRDTVLASFYDISLIDETKLPKNLAEFSFKSGLYTVEQVEIIQSEAEDILQKIRDSIWTSKEVTEAFLKAAAIAQRMVSLE